MDYNSNIFGWKPKEFEVDPNAIGDEYIEIMLLEKTFPQTYLKECDETTNIQGFPKTPTHKEGGILCKAVIIGRSRSNQDSRCTEKLFLEDTKTGKLIHPGIICTVSLTVNPLDKIYSNGYNFDAKVLGEKLSYEKPKAIQYYPNAAESAIWKNGKAIKLSEIEPSHPGLTNEEYDKLKQAETERKQHWSAILDEWTKADENTAVIALSQIFSRKYGLCNKIDGKLEFVPPSIGISFVCRNIPKEGSMFPNPVIFRNLKGDDGKWKSECYSSLEVHKYGKEYVDAIKLCLAEEKARRDEEKSKKEQNRKDEEAYNEPYIPSEEDNEAW